MPAPRAYPVLAMGLFALSLVACGSSEELSKDDDPNKLLIGMRDEGPSDRYEIKDLLVRPFDLSRDNSADLWKIYSVSKENVDDEEDTVRLLRKEVDSNLDGRVDLWFIYNHQERLIREEADYDFDGYVDVISHFEKGRLQQREIYKRGSSSPCQVKSYRDNTLFKVENDPNCDGVVERWELFDQGRLVQVGHDVDKDGRVDYWDSYD